MRPYPLMHKLRVRACKTSTKIDQALFAQAADTIEELCEALTDFIAGADAGHVPLETDMRARNALAKALDKQEFAA